MKKRLLFLLLFVICYFLFVKSAYGAASLSLSPTSKSVSAGQTFTVDVNLNTGGSSSNGCDVILTFNPQIIKVDTVSFGANPLYSTTNKQTIDNTNGKLTLNSSVMSSAFAFSGSGVLATITFKAEGSGSSAVSFTCTSGLATDTNVWDTQSQDIVNCQSNISGTYTVGSSTSPTATPAPGGSEATPTPEQPEVGNSALTTSFVILGTFFFLSGLLIRFLFLKG